MIDASSSVIAFIPEVNWGVTPATPAFRRVRITGEGLGSSLESIQSEELDPTASVKDLIRVGGGAQGDINTELSFGSEFDELFEATLRGTFDADTGILKAGNAIKSMTFEKGITDGTTDYLFRYKGSRSNSMAVDITTDSVIKAVFNFLGAGEAPATAPLSGATYVDPNTNDVMSVPELRALAVIGVAEELVFSDLSFTLNNNLRSQKGFSTATTNYPDVDAKGIGFGRREVTGNMNAYFDGLTLYNKFINGDAISFSFVLSDGDGNGYCVTFPKVKFSQGNVQVQGNNSDVMQALQWQAIKDAITETDMIMFKHPLNTVVKTITESDTLDVAVAGDYVLASGTVDTADAVYVRIDGMFVLQWDAVDTWEFKQTGGDVYYTRNDPDVDGVYVAEAGYGTEVPTVADA